MVRPDRKQAVSLRLSGNDLRKLRALSERLGASDSDVLRFALTSTLNRLGPLCDPMTCGSALVPALVEAGADFLRHFDLDASRLEQIVNANAQRDRQVAREDLVMLCFAMANPDFAWSRLSKTTVPQSMNIDGEALRVVSGSPDAIQSLREHLYAKYVATATPQTGLGAAEALSEELKTAPRD